MVKNLLQCGRPSSDPWVGQIPWRRKEQPTPVFLPGESHGKRSLAGSSLWSGKESDRTERLTLYTSRGSLYSPGISPLCMLWLEFSLYFAFWLVWCLSVCLGGFFPFVLHFVFLFWPWHTACRICYQIRDRNCAPFSRLIGKSLFVFAFTTHKFACFVLFLISLFFLGF